jgi:hypothetical protein
LFEQYDADGGREALVRVRAVLDRRKYIANLIEELEETEPRP